MTENIELQVVNTAGSTVGTKSIDAKVFDDSAPKSLLHQVVRWQRASWRSGTHKVQTRAEMAGGGKKPWKQKGTGNARSGSNTSPLWVGGGIAHGPKPRSYDFRMNKKERKLALAGAIAARKNEGKLIVLNEFSLSEVKTKTAKQILDAVGLKNAKSVLVVLPTYSENIVKSLRNIEGVKVVDPLGLNVYDIVAHQYMLVVADAFQGIEARLS